MINSPLFNFAFHTTGWLDKIRGFAKEEPWGANNKVLEIYLKNNFEIAKSQGKVFEDEEHGLAFWRAGYLVNSAADPIWLVYKPNRNPKNKWLFDKVQCGDCPVPGRAREDFQVKYSPPEFNTNWPIHFDQRNIDHIFNDHQIRLNEVFGPTMSGNKHLLFRLIFGEVELQRKQEVAIPQWYHNDYCFLMPLFLTQGEKVELTAALTPNEALKRYELRTLLLPHYSYAHARSVVKSRASFAGWMMLDTTVLSHPFVDSEAEGTDE